VVSQFEIFAFKNVFFLVPLAAVRITNSHGVKLTGDLCADRMPFCTRFEICPFICSTNSGRRVGNASRSQFKACLVIDPAKVVFEFIPCIDFAAGISGVPVQLHHPLVE
jgi:hypothetical protein